ncbi:cyclophilin peptidyl-prolyl cis-trans isomerase Cyp8 [Friedmanniomyces endolithicus]|nr:cyclophilin peptidyl-prolyl cis-trans isomerase Cyp8 [Friedmanniomyces endolithicus]KAK0768503.1 cyclophilin peptidyl-prolyl cis-trans isomerase Cyp8 [Friedmanniomyces endolithicus]KAK0789874.1 cyclophilin peptidyl-prolyl cis-trans isomerase Cyp8 [Friedmanniomyces endolithicus]KAK0887284.1 cyclophilin peptidyl-prolyl cis-trans isomerase Cyp8 [Friedmanniomyces endolithicus]
MGKGTDKLYIMHSEWSSADAFSTSAGANARKPTGPSSNFKRLPYNYCALSLQPFEHPVCTPAGTIFDLTHILPWLRKHAGKDPVNGEPLKSSDLIKLHFAKNDEGEYVDPVTFKVFTDNTHIVALRNTGNVFAYETIERLNIKAKKWRDLVSDEEFKRSDVIVLQDPQNVESRDMSRFKFLMEGEKSVLAPEQEGEREAEAKRGNVGNAAKILQAKEAVAKRRELREKGTAGQNGNSAESQALVNARKAHAEVAKSNARTTKPVPYNAAQYTSGAAAASFTSTGLTPSTSGARAILTDEQYMLSKPRLIKQKGYARIATTHGDLTLELYPEFAPKAVWNFITLAKRGYYKGVGFHRNIRSFMLQGGDPTGTGRGGQSCWGKAFADEIEGPLTLDGRGVVAMANKGKDTNTSQFFVLYRKAEHLNRKHTVFGRVIEGLNTTLNALEAVEVDDKSRPLEECGIEDVVVYVDPFEEFMKQRSEKEAEEARREQIRKEGGAEDERTTWTGKRVRGDGKVMEGDDEQVGVGKYMKQAEGAVQIGREDEIVEEWEEPEPMTKKVKKGGGGFGNFDSW